MIGTLCWKKIPRHDLKKWNNCIQEIIPYTYIAYGTYYNQNVRLTPMQIQRK